MIPATALALSARFVVTSLDVCSRRCARSALIYAEDITYSVTNVTQRGVLRALRAGDEDELTCAGAGLAMLTPMQLDAGDAGCR
jgi:hypothetical protein